MHADGAASWWSAGQGDVLGARLPVTQVSSHGAEAGRLLRALRTRQRLSGRRDVTGGRPRVRRSTVSFPGARARSRRHLAARWRRLLSLSMQGELREQILYYSQFVLLNAKKLKLYCSIILIIYCNYVFHRNHYSCCNVETMLPSIQYFESEPCIIYTALFWIDISRRLAIVCELLLRCVTVWSRVLLGGRELYADEYSGDDDFTRAGETRWWRHGRPRRGGRRLTRRDRQHTADTKYNSVHTAPQHGFSWLILCPSPIQDVRHHVRYTA